MNYRASIRFALLASTLAIACADDGPADDDVGNDTEDSTSSDASSSESESGSTDDADTGESSDATDSTGSTGDESTTDTTDTADTTDSTEGETTDTADTTEGETTDTGEEIMCPDVFPAFDKGCSGDSECAVVIHTTDCCGNSVAWGINEADVAAFDAAEAVCDAQYPDCDCPQGPTVAEDGNEAWEPAEFGAECVMGSCMSYVL